MTRPRSPAEHRADAAQALVETLTTHFPDARMLQLPEDVHDLHALHAPSSNGVHVLVLKPGTRCSVVHAVAELLAHPETAEFALGEVERACQRVREAHRRGSLVHDSGV